MKLSLAPYFQQPCFKLVLAKASCFIPHCPQKKMSILQLSFWTVKLFFCCFLDIFMHAPINTFPDCASLFLDFFDAYPSYSQCDQCCASLWIIIVKNISEYYCFLHIKLFHVQWMSSMWNVNICLGLKCYSPGNKNNEHN